MKKKFAIAVATVISVSILETVAAMADDSITINFFSNLPDRTTGQGYVEQTLLDLYMKENPDVTVKVDAVDDESYRTRFRGFTSDKSIPDIVNVWGQPSFMSEAVNSNLLSELNPNDYMDYNFFSGSLNGFTQNRKLYGLARNTDVMGFYYNKALFEKYGIEVPKTWDDLTAAVKIFSSKAVIPIAMDGLDKYPVVTMIEDVYQKLEGPDTYDESMYAVSSGQYDSNWRKAADMVQNLAMNNAFEVGFEKTDFNSAKNLFTSGQAAMYYMGSWEMSLASDKNISSNIRKNIGVFLMPLVEGGAGTVQDICGWNGGGYAVAANSPVKEEATKLLNYMFLPDNWTKLCWETGAAMSAQDFSKYATGNETDAQTTWAHAVDNAVSFTGVTFNDLGSSKFKDVSETASIELATGSIDSDEYFNQLSSLAD